LSSQTFLPETKYNRLYNVILFVISSFEPDAMSITATNVARMVETRHCCCFIAVTADSGVSARLVISIPVINWASHAPNAGRRTLCIAPSIEQLQSPLTRSAADHRDHPGGFTSPWSTHQCFQPQRAYNYDRSWYDGLNQLDYTCE